MKTPTTSQLLEKARLGDDAALEELCGQLIPQLRTWAAGRLPSYARDVRETSDLVQEVLVKALPRFLGDFEDRKDHSMISYLQRGIVNRIRDEVRRVTRQGARTEVSPNLCDTGLGPFDSTVIQENSDRYTAALKRLRPADREAIVARLEMGLDYEEAARMLGKPTPDAARVAIRRAIEKLADEIVKD